MLSKKFIPLVPERNPLGLKPGYIRSSDPRTKVRGFHDCANGLLSARHDLWG